MLLQFEHVKAFNFNLPQSCTKSVKKPLHVIVSSEVASARALNLHHPVVLVRTVSLECHNLLENTSLLHRKELCDHNCHCIFMNITLRLCLFLNFSTFHGEKRSFSEFFGTFYVQTGFALYFITLTSLN
jgi:hypothetical protein